MLSQTRMLRHGLVTNRQGFGRRQIVNRSLHTVVARCKPNYCKTVLCKTVPQLPVEQVRLSQFQTSAAHNGSCLPTPLPPKCGPKNCAIPKPNVWRDCKMKKRPKWKGCEKICMPCCCPAHDPPDCQTIEIRLNTCKRPEYRIPAFTECRKYPLGQKLKKECCYQTVPCPEAGIDTIIEPLVATKVRQETILGRRRGGNIRMFSTSTAVHAKNDCMKKGTLPCLKPSGITGKVSKKAQNKDCEKQCMPCCRPARDPPECYYPYVKTDCTRLKPPRPSFSECEKNKMRNIPECECSVGPLPPCKGSAGSSLKSC